MKEYQRYLVSPWCSRHNFSSPTVEQPPSFPLDQSPPRVNCPSLCLNPLFCLLVQQHEKWFSPIQCVHDWGLGHASESIAGRPGLDVCKMLSFVVCLYNFHSGFIWNSQKLCGRKNSKIVSRFLAPRMQVPFPNYSNTNLAMPVKWLCKC